MNRIISFFLCCWALLSGIQAQELTVKSMLATPMDLSASQYERKDLAGHSCGLVKVQLTAMGAQFEGNVIGEPEYKTGEYWVYMTQGSYMLRIKHPNFLPLDVNFRNYSISGVDSKVTYVLTLLMPQSSSMDYNDGMSYLALTVEPPSATVYIDDELQALQGGTLSMLLPVGKHRYKVEAPTYKPQSGSFTIGRERLPMTVRLSSVKSSLSISSTTQGTEIYVNDSLYGISSWHGSLPAGNYRVEGRLSGYRSHRQSVKLKPSEEVRLTIPVLQRSTGIINVNCQPMNAEVWIDGRKAGTNPDVFRDISVGRHEIEIRADGYGSEKSTVLVEDGKTALVKISLKKLVPDEQINASAIQQTIVSPQKQGVETFTVNGVSFNMIHVDGGTLNNKMMWQHIEKDTIIKSFKSRLSEVDSKIQMLDYLREYVNNPKNQYEIIPQESVNIPWLSNQYVNILSLVGLDSVSYSLIKSYNQAVIDRNLLLKSTSEETPQVEALTATIDEYRNSIKTALLQARRCADISRQGVQNVYAALLAKLLKWKQKGEGTIIISWLYASARISEASSKIQMLDYSREYVNNPKNKYEIIPSQLGLDNESYSLINSHNQAVLDRKILLKGNSEEPPRVKALTATIDELRDSIKTALLNARRLAEINRQRLQSNYIAMDSALSKLHSPQTDDGYQTISDYWIGETEVTQELWEAVMGSNPSKFLGDNLPVEQVSWNDCQEFISKLCTLTGRNFRLPNEWEWVYAERGGSKSRGYDYSGSNAIDDVVWYEHNSSDMTHHVKTKQANELGLYDMSGNVSEWCQEWYNVYKRQDFDLSSIRIIRGSSWDSYTDLPSYRLMSLPEVKDSGFGLRLAY